MDKYIFKSDRLGFRNWLETDIPLMAKINADPEVMRFFPNTTDYEQTANHAKKMHNQFLEKGYCYFAVDQLSDGAFIGFIGLSYQNYEASFTPCVDIGWRLSQSAWGKGFATEGAKKCLEYGFNRLNIKEIKAVCPVVNVPSENVMKKIGMQKELVFDHPALGEFPNIEQCVLYGIKSNG